MLANTIYLHRLAIERKTLGSIEFEGTESSSGSVGINHVTSYKNLGLYCINIRRLTRPKSGFAHLYHRLQTSGFAYCPTLAVEQDVAHRKLNIVRVIHRDIHLHLVAFCHNMSAPMGDMNHMGLVEPHMAVDTTTAIPSAIRLVAVIHTYRHNVLPAIYDIRCKIVTV